MISDPLKVLFGGIAMAILFIGFLFYMREARGKENFNERAILYAFSLFLLCDAGFILSNLMEIFVLPVTFKHNAFYIDFTILNAQELTGYVIIYKIFTGLFYTSTCLAILAFEIIYKRTKYLLTISFSILIIITLIAPYDLMVFNFLAYNFGSFFFMLILVIYIKWSQIEYKVISSYIMTGTVFVGHAVVIIGNVELIGYAFPVWLPSVFFCIAGILLLFPLLIKTSDFSHNWKYWILFNSITIGVQIYLQIVTFVAGFPDYLIFSYFVYTIFYIIVQYITIRYIKGYFDEILPKQDVASKLNIYSTFTKPQKLTEEEVSISKEKMICLVCKTALSKQIFLCSECGAFYCIKCSEALSDLENSCWVCNSPFNNLKPTKPFKIEEKELGVEVSEKTREKN